MCTHEVWGGILVFLLFDYLFIMGRNGVIFGQHTVSPFINKVIKFQHDCLNSN